MNDIAVEALEVFLNHILYVRDVYPGQIFKKRRIYNTPVYISIYPPLNTYLYKILRTSRELLKTQELRGLELLLYKDEEHNYERYQLRIKEPTATVNDEFLMEFEDQLRTSLSSISERLKALEKLPTDCKFKVLVHTTQSGFIRLTHNAHYQDFPWLRADDPSKNISVKNEISLLPLTSLQQLDLSVLAEVFS